MTPVELLRWVSSVDADPGVVGNLISFGITDTVALCRALRMPSAARQAVGEIAELRGLDAPPFLPPDDTTLAEHLPLVGARVFAFDYGNLDLWAGVTDRISAYREQWRLTAPRPDRSSARMIDELLAAGRGPAYAIAIIDAALANGTAPDVFGFGPDITVDAFHRLCSAGIRTRQDLNLFAHAGLTEAEALAAAGDGIPPAAAWAAHETGLPAQDWVRLLPGLNPRWFPSTRTEMPSGVPVDPTSGILSVPDITWEVLREFADTGWGELTTSMLRTGKTWGSKPDDFTGITIPAVLAAGRAGVSLADIRTWSAVLYVGKRGETWTSKTLPSLTGRYYATLTETTTAIVQLRGAGIKPSWVGPYRAAGARSIDDALRLAQAGITGPGAKTLIEQHGEARDRYSPKRIRSVDETLRVAAHEGSVSRP